MSIVEPKAPIVRIRKKKVKKKAKDNDVVILPVRASQNPRYSSLTTPPNPQTKGRECCRHMFAGCLKIPVCKLICFKCILPKCYSGNGSDDEECEVKDEGYHSQNRRSSEILPQAEGGAQGGAEPEEVEMSEIKGETVTLIPPPRTRVNDYRKEPGRADSKSRLGAAGSSTDDGEVTYIEVESVSLHNEHIPENSDSREVTLVKLETGYEEPVQAGVCVEKLQVVIESNKKLNFEPEYDDGENSDDSESKYYVNEDVLKPNSDSLKLSSKEEMVVKLVEDKHYINLDSVTPSVSKSHSDNSSQVSVEITDSTPHEYVNLKPLEDTEGQPDNNTEKTTNNLEITTQITDQLSLKTGPVENGPHAETELIVDLESKSKGIFETDKHTFQSVLLPEKMKTLAAEDTSDVDSEVKVGESADDTDSHTSEEDAVGDVTSDQTKLL